MTKFNFVVNIEVAEYKGEDANLAPSKEDFGQTLLMGVFDGLGGRSAGYDGKTGGRIASEEASKITKNFFKQSHNQITPENVIQLQEEICRSLKNQADSKMPPRTSSRLKGSLVEHRLCTTIALASIKQQGQEKIFEANLAWMGDSRIYFLSPTKGLQQLTKDDLVTPKDAWEMLRQDPPLSQYLTADINPRWQIHFQTYKIEEIGCFLACTDGCFQYFSAPWEFEKFLLDSLSLSEGDKISDNNWQELICKKYTEIKQDDVSLILHAAGFNYIKHLKNSYQYRLQYLKEKFIVPTANTRYEELQSLWEEYRKNYEYYFQFIPKIQPITHSQAQILEEDSSSAITYVTSSVSENKFKDLSKSFQDKARNKAEEINNLLEQAYYSYNKNSLKEAERLCNQVLTIEKHNCECQYLLGLIYYKLANSEINQYQKRAIFQKAASYFEEVVNNPAVKRLITAEKLIDSYLILAYIYYHLNQDSNAVKNYQLFFDSEGAERIDEWEQHLEFFVNSLRASLNNKCEPANAAIQFCLRLVNTNIILSYGKKPIIYYFMAVLQEIQGELNAALNSLETVLKSSSELSIQMQKKARQKHQEILNKLKLRGYY